MPYNHAFIASVRFMHQGDGSMPGYEAIENVRNIDRLPRHVKYHLSYIIMRINNENEVYHHVRRCLVSRPGRVVCYHQRGTSSQYLGVEMQYITNWLNIHYRYIAKRNVIAAQLADSGGLMTRGDGGVAMHAVTVCAICR